MVLDGNGGAALGSDRVRRCAPFSVQASEAARDVNTWAASASGSRPLPLEERRQRPSAMKLASFLTKALPRYPSGQGSHLPMSPTFQPALTTSPGCSRL
jgi:hypothetical protein